MEALPAVSVVISTFRRPHFLNQALDSIYSQTFKDFEVIVADDGSGEDFTSQYDLRHGDTKLVCHTQPGNGAAATRNLGTRIARGRYIAYLDDDDVWLPEKLEKQVQALEDHPEFGLTYCHHTLVDQDLEPLQSQPSPKLMSGDCLRRMLQGNFVKSPSCVLVRREVLDKCGLYDERLLISEDWEMWARAARFCLFHADPEPLVLYRTHPAQKTSRSAAVRRLGQIKVVEAIQEWVEADIPELRSVVRRSLAFRLQRLSRWQSRDGDHRAALNTIFRSIALYPWDIRPYSRLVQVLAYALRGRGKTD